MERLNMFNDKTVNNLDSDTKEAITIITEDSGAGYQFYCKLFENDNTINIISSKGKQLIFDKVAEINNTTIVIFDSAINFFEMRKLKNKFRLNLIKQKVFYFTPMCFEEVILSMDCKEIFSVYKENDFIDLIINSYRNHYNYMDYFDYSFKDNKVNIILNSNYYSGKTIEDVYKQVLAKVYSGTNMEVSSKTISKCYFSSCLECNKFCKIEKDKFEIIINHSIVKYLIELIRSIRSGNTIINNRIRGVLK